MKITSKLYSNQKSSYMLTASHSMIISAVIADALDRCPPVTLQVWLTQKLPEKHAVCHVLDQRSLGRAVLEPDTVADLMVKSGQDSLVSLLKQSPLATSPLGT